jgi:hypothetical protein
VAGPSQSPWQVVFFPSEKSGSLSPYGTYLILAALAAVAFAGLVGAVAGARRIRLERQRKEAEGWFKRFREDSAEPLADEESR